MTERREIAAAGPDGCGFAAAEDRRRLSPPAIRAFCSLADLWGLSAPEAAKLLDVSESTCRRIRADRWNQPLSQDQLTRVSLLVGVFEDLASVFADDMPRRWPRRPNTGPLFAGRSPIAAMIAGGIPLMLEVRRHVQAFVAGP